jgi:hypothetical protein
MRRVGISIGLWYLHKAMLIGNTSHRKSFSANCANPLTGLKVIASHKGRPFFVGVLLVIANNGLFGDANSRLPARCGHIPVVRV